jgi:methylmalonyl-CoA mutase C-terminal domain/subunit
MMTPAWNTDDETAPVRVMLAKIGLDGHDRGVKVVARTLRDAGMEVIYTGLHRSPDQVVEAAIQEDVDVLGVSLLSGAHLPIFTRIFEIIRGLPEPPRFAILAGGVMPDEDEAALKEMGVAEVLGQDTTPETIVSRVRALVIPESTARPEALARPGTPRA